ncbi:hypothetical protein [Clostridium folliculivorans]|uniref:DUF11 domain-containing protein n=1 Tax=Clostridium folliculivorans TaxID=2886038 RepID=A0A9W5Y1R3_9CLOT|nr:hypothetical protein [Clostridium folliculivorans]GKU25134.1 hypothetical protein CFOLD11_19600 [Clostridium folliculivorans]GKU31232.1 hypothetical protein CFB3_33390 [Clostridium folliculivorans]
MEVVNVCRANFDYKLSPRGHRIKNTVVSNVVSTKIIDKVLDLKICVNKSEAVVFDIVTYTVTIKNISDKLIENITFIDHKSFLTSFVVNTLFVNNKNITCRSPEEGLYLGDLQPCDEIIVSFQMLIDKNSSSKYVYNYFEIAYDYLFNIELLPARIILKSDFAATYVRALLKQFDILSILNLPFEDTQLIEDIDITEDIHLSMKKLVSTPIISVASAPLTKCLRLILIGTINYTLFGIIDKPTINSTITVYSDDFTDSFVISTLVPESMNLLNLEEIENINFHIENFQKVILENNRLLIQTLILLKIY